MNEIRGLAVLSKRNFYTGYAKCTAARGSSPHALCMNRGKKRFSEARQSTNSSRYFCHINLLVLKHFGGTVTYQDISIYNKFNHLKSRDTVPFDPFNCNTILHTTFRQHGRYGQRYICRRDSFGKRYTFRQLACFKKISILRQHCSFKKILL